MRKEPGRQGRLFIHEERPSELAHVRSLGETPTGLLIVDGKYKNIGARYHGMMRWNRNQAQQKRTSPSLPGDV